MLLLQCFRRLQTCKNVVNKFMTLINLCIIHLILETQQTDVDVSYIFMNQSYKSVLFKIHQSTDDITQIDCPYVHQAIFTFAFGGKPGVCKVYYCERDSVTNCDEFITDLFYILNILPEQTCATNRQFSRSLHPIFFAWIFYY